VSQIIVSTWGKLVAITNSPCLEISRREQSFVLFILPLDVCDIPVTLSVGREP